MAQELNIELKLQTLDAADKLAAWVQGANQQIGAVNGQQIAMLTQLQQSVTGFSARALSANGHLVQGLEGQVTHMRGVMYAFRGSIDATRFALAGGGPRAAFYAGDEFIRFLVASGIGIAGLLPAIAALTIALAPTGVAAWMAYKAAQNEAKTEAELNSEVMRDQKQLLEDLGKASKAGLVSPEDNDFFKKMLEIGSYSSVSYVQHRMVMEGLTKPAVEAYDALTKLEERMQQEDDTSAGLAGRAARASSDLQKTIAEIKAQAAVAGSLYPQAQMDADIAEAQKVYAQKKAELMKQAGEQDKADILQQLNIDLSNIRAGYQQTANSQGGKLTTQQQGFQNIEETSATSGAYYKLLQLGLITQLEYNEKIAAEREKTLQTEGRITDEVKRQNDEKQKQLQQAAEIARAELEANLEAVRGNPFIGQRQKDAEELHIQNLLLIDDANRLADLNATVAATSDDAAKLEAQKQIVELKKEQAELENKIAEIKARYSVTASASIDFNKLQDQLGTPQEMLGQLPASQFAGFQSAMQSAFESLFQPDKVIGTRMGQVITERGQDFGSKLGLAMEKSFASSLSKMMSDFVTWIAMAIAKWVVGQVEMAVTGQAAGAAAGSSSLATTTALASAQSAIWATPATLATIATSGTAALTAPALIAAAEAMTLGTAAIRDSGGPGVAGHAYAIGTGAQPELFVPKSDGMFYPRSQLSTVAGRGFGGNVTVEGHKISQHFYDERPHPRDYLASSEGQAQLVNITKKNRLKIGIGT